MTDYANCPWCNVTSMVTDKVLNRKCHHAIMTYNEGSTFQSRDTGTIIRFSTPDRLENKDVRCAVRAVITDKRFHTAIEAMDLDMIDEIERKLAHRRAELGA